MAKPTKNLKTLKKGRATALKTVNTVNTKAIELTEDLINGSVATGVKYQKLAATALKKSEPIMAKNVDMAFDTVEALYGQMISANTRLQKLFGIEKTVKNAKSTLWNTYQSTSKLAEKNIDDATNILKAAANEIDESMEMITKKIKKSAKKAEKQIKATAEMVTDTATSKAPKSKKAKKAKKAAKKAIKSTAAKAKKATKKVTAKKATAKKVVRKSAPKRTAKATEKFEDTVTVITSKRAAAAKRAGSTVKRATKKVTATRKPATRKRTTKK